MNYKKHYDLLISRSKNRILEGYSEKHHIIPKCVGGTDDPSNLVILTAEEHFVAHQLLVKMYPNNAKLALAVSMMCIKNPKHQRNNKIYGWLRKAFSEAQKTKIRKPRAKETKPRKKRTLSEEHKTKIGLSLIGKDSPMKGKQFTAEHKRKLSQNHKSKNQTLLP